MKNLIVTIFLFFLPSWAVYGQFTFVCIDFENINGCYETVLTPLDSNSLWQIGMPQKTLFDAAYTLPNALVTDTLNPYPINDTSSFTILHLAWQGFTFPQNVFMEFQYQIDSDSLTDYGTIEFSPDNGSSWINLLTDSVLIDTLNNYYWHAYSWGTGRIVLNPFTGSSNGWKLFSIMNMGYLGSAFHIQDGDTVLYRFTFISDSIQTNKDGWMIDNFAFEDYAESVVSLPKNTFQSKAFPNPASEQLSIEFENLENEHFELFLYNAYGQLILTKQIEAANFIDISLHLLPQGIYHYELKNKKKHSVGKFSVLRD